MKKVATIRLPTLMDAIPKSKGFGDGREGLYVVQTRNRLGARETQPTAFFTSAAIFASSVAVNSFKA